MKNHLETTRKNKIKVQKNQTMTQKVYTLNSTKV